MLKAGGRLILSANHPILYTALKPDGEYFDVAGFSYDAEHAGRTVVYTNWHRPLQAMSDACTAAGFRISVISEPPIAPDTPAELRPQELKHPRGSSASSSSSSRRADSTSHTYSNPYAACADKRHYVNLYAPCIR